MDTPKELIVYTDGACVDNTVGCGIGGWSAILIGRKMVKGIYGGEIKTTNNRMEMMAAIKAMELFNVPLTILIHTDSQYLQKGASSWIVGWKKKNKLDSMKNADLWKRVDELQRFHQVKWKWVKGHAGNLYNEKADELACLGIERARQGLFDHQVIDFPR